MAPNEIVSAELPAVSPKEPNSSPKVVHAPPLLFPYPLIVILKFASIDSTLPFGPKYYFNMIKLFPPFTTRMQLSGYQCPILGADNQGSCFGKGSPFCNNSIEILSGERIKAMWPSLGGLLIMTSHSCKCWQIL